jgi:hypothetical protein
VLAWVIAAVFVAVELAVSGRYGFQQDELYFIVAGRHLAFGYVDQPPLTPLLTRIADILGVTPMAVRIVPALFGGAIVVIAGRARSAVRGGPVRPSAGADWGTEQGDRRAWWRDEILSGRRAKSALGVPASAERLQPGSPSVAGHLALGWL